MKKLLLSVLIFLTTLITVDCQHSKNSMLDKYDLYNKSNKVFYLPKELKEVSGLAFGGDDIIYMHNDEKGIVYKFDIKKEKIISEYDLGEKQIKKDFEDIAVVNDSVYLITSSGVLYKFSLEDGKNELPFEKIETGLNEKNNIEGLCYNSHNNSFLLACKDSPGKGYKGYRAVYEFNLNDQKLKSKPRFLISLDKLKHEYDFKDFAPSGIELHKKSEHYFLISAAPEVIIELDSEGNLIDAKKFNNKIHKQPEGITFLEDGTLIISDEGKDKKAKITIIQQSK